MSHFYGDLQGSRGSATRCGTRSSGISSHPRGWNVGVKVEGSNCGTYDVFGIDLTRGSNDAERRQPLATVHTDSKGRWHVVLTRPDGTTETLVYGEAEPDERRTTITDDEREAFVGDLERAGRHLAEDVENEDAQGMASDLFNIAHVLESGSADLARDMERGK